MTTATVGLEAALALRDVFGYPQNSWPQSTWERWRDNTVPGRAYHGWQFFSADTGKHPYEREYVAAPDPLTALMFLEEQHGWVWGRHLPYEPMWYAYKDILEFEARADDPDALILAIAEHHLQHANTLPQEGAQPP